MLKWAGGKRRLLKHILPLAPEKFDCYHEPFAGGAALFFALQPHRGLLSDLNEDLINCYVQVRDNPIGVIKSLECMLNTKQEYYRIRSAIYLGDIDRAARLIYLTSLSFNGIYRTNLKGEFNVPYGNRSHVEPCDPSEIIRASRVLQSVDIRAEDFSTALDRAGKGDFVYIDPPYTVAHGNNGFIKYNSTIFSWNDQIRLAKKVADLADRGCYVMVSNADHSSIRELYNGMSVKVIERSSVIAASTGHRQKVTECLFYKCK